MKIGSLDTKPLPAALAPVDSERKPAGAAATKPGSGSGASAQVALSPAARFLASNQPTSAGGAARATGAIEADPTFDSAKVERIAQAIRDGKFQVNAEAIADKLIANANELMGRRPN